MTSLENRPGWVKTRPASSLFGLAPGGVCRAGPVARPAVRSYRTLSPLPAEAGGLLSVALSLGSPPAAVSRHRISMEPGLSSPFGCGHPVNWRGLSAREPVKGQAALFGGGSLMIWLGLIDRLHAGRGDVDEL